MKKISVCLEGSIFGPAHSDANGILKVREHVRDQDSHKHINNHQSQPPPHLGCSIISAANIITRCSSHKLKSLVSS